MNNGNEGTFDSTANLPVKVVLIDTHIGYSTINATGCMWAEKPVIVLTSTLILGKFNQLMSLKPVQGKVETYLKEMLKWMTLMKKNTWGI